MKRTKEDLISYLRDTEGMRRKDAASLQPGQDLVVTVERVK